jgi:hypothetical protein
VVPAYSAVRLDGNALSEILVTIDESGPAKTRTELEHAYRPRVVWDRDDRPDADCGGVVQIARARPWAESEGRNTWSVKSGGVRTQISANFCDESGKEKPGTRVALTR